MGERGRYGDISRKILEVICETAQTAADVVAVIVSNPYGTSYGKLARQLHLRERDRAREKASREQARAVVQRYYSLIYYLKRRGLIVETEREQKKILHATSRGRSALQQMNERRESQPPAPNYSTRPGKKIVLVGFDVPEKERHKRDWLREALSNLGMKMIQRSLWLGKVKIPSRFLEDLRMLKMVEYVEIFEITSSGGVTHLL
ncbi:MAG: CRISPR-associated endonuclease Cas2 [Candidatus Liptonbacteria bacterium]|nr:CRISPR-associated endonuclease Cas2 [Candidatus Liptonbacteria bacterium]